MNDHLIITSYVIIDDVMRSLNHRSHPLAKITDSEVLTVAVVAAKYFRNNHERALWVLTELGYLSERLSTSRLNRRLHRVADYLGLIVETLGELFAQGAVFIIHSMPLPVCRRARARRNRKVRGREYCGFCAAKREKFFGFRLHLVSTPEGLPVSFAIVAGGYHDLTPLHELLFALPAGACVFGDKGYNSAPDEATILNETGERVIPIRRKNMARHEWVDEFDLKQYRKGIETVNSQLEKMGAQQLHARTNAGFEVKVHASLFALTCSNIN